MKNNSKGAREKIDQEFPQSPEIGGNQQTMWLENLEDAGLKN